ncbi:DUF6221 family protein [Streptomyces sp. HD1123-B1]|uniref:DUF6221 family protein n=1 Tax=Streptomyces huangiella TaxID=3228804 RepID=UPI003D7E4D8F
MDELARWLGEQLDEDERIARAAGGKYESGQGWWEDGRFGSDGTVGDERGSVVVYRTGVGRQHSAHIARHDPARVLREIDAKRRIVAEHDTDGWTTGDRVRDCQWTGRPCQTLRLLALPYADRPGYREEWRP